MKKFLLAFTLLASLPAFANDGAALARNRYVCYYKDSFMGYSYGAGGPTMAIAKARAFRTCREEGRNDHMTPRCTFQGCRALW